MRLLFALLLTFAATACLGDVGTDTRGGAGGAAAPERPVSVGVQAQALSITKSFINSDNGAAIFRDHFSINALRCWVMAKCTGGGLCSNNNYDCHYVQPNTQGIAVACDNLQDPTGIPSYFAKNCTSTGCTVVSNQISGNEGTFQYGSDLHKVFATGSMINYGHAECAYSNASNEATGKPFVHFWQ